MNPQRIFGLVLLVVGVVLVVMGRNASHSMADQLSNSFSGRFTDRTTWYIVGGIALAVLGSLLALFGGGRRRLA